MVTEQLQKLELGISNRLAKQENRLKHSFVTEENIAPLNIEVFALRLAHPLVSKIVTVAEILTPRSTE
ncbi:MAG TPA: hypothetical protein PKB09_01560 [Candidatus Saccharibacteria bacterium]|nr:hypothetical protein [Candidatus Saccharibacteria bacterium]